MNRPEEAIIEDIERVVREFTTEQSIEAWNNRCEKIHYYEDYIYILSDEVIDEELYNKTPSELIRMGRDIDLNDDYYYYHLDELRTTNDIYDIVDDSEIADYVIDYDDDCGDSELRELLDELAEVREY